MFLGFANFFQHFIQGFSKIAALLTLLLKTTRSLEKLALKAFKAGNNKVVGGGSGRADEIIINLSKNKKSKKLMRVPNIRAIGKPNFLISNAKKTFNHLRLAFTKALILWYFDLESHIQIEIDASSYAIGRVLSLLNLDFDVLSNDLKKSDFN